MKRMSRPIRPGDYLIITQGEESDRYTILTVGNEITARSDQGEVVRLRPDGNEWKVVGLSSPYELEFISAEEVDLLSSLSPELIMIIGMELPLSDLVKFCRASQRFNSILCSDNYFWKRRYLKDFGEFKLPVTDWKNAYYEALSMRIWLFGYLKTEEGIVRLSHYSCPSSIKVKQVSSGYNFSVIIDTNDDVWVMGANNHGQLGMGDVRYINSFTRLPGIKARSVTCGSSFTFLISSDPDGAVWAFGNNKYGQLGLDTHESIVTSPRQVPGLRAKAIGAGIGHAVLIDLDGTVWVTGCNHKGQLGLGYAGGSKRGFTRLSLQAESVGAGGAFTMLIDPSGDLWSFGYNKNGKLGLGSDSEVVVTPTRVPGIKAKSVSCGWSHALVITPDKTVLATGLNLHGQAGLGSTSGTDVFTPVGVSEAKMISVGRTTSMILDTSGNVWISGGLSRYIFRQEKNVFTQVPNIVSRYISMGETHGVIIGKSK